MIFSLPSISPNVPDVCEVAEGNLPSQASNGERQAEAPAETQHIHHVRRSTLWLLDCIL
jgi:hypothetical protein